jgi:DNA-binding LytR/AlgR family response regulator
LNFRWLRAPPDFARLTLARTAVELLRRITVQRARVTADDVVYFRADNKYVAIVTANTEALISLRSKELIGRLDGEEFWQAHRSTT